MIFPCKVKQLVTSFSVTLLYLFIFWYFRLLKLLKDLRKKNKKDGEFILWEEASKYDLNVGCRTFEFTIFTELK